MYEQRYMMGDVSENWIIGRDIQFTQLKSYAKSTGTQSLEEPAVTNN